LGRNSIKVVNFGGYLEGKYKLTEQLGSGIVNASASVKEEYKQASAVIDFAASAAGVALENEAAIKDSVDSITTAVAGAACLAGDAAVQVLDTTVDALGELGKNSSKKSNSQDTGGSQGVTVPATSQTKQLPTAGQEDAALSAEVRKDSTEQLPVNSQEFAVLPTKADKGSGASTQSIVDFSAPPVRFKVPATPQKK